MTRTTLSSKGQVILPKEIRDAHRWRAGTQFIVEDQGDGVILRPVPPFKPTRIEDVAGCLRRPGQKPKTIAQMDAAIAAGVKARRDRGRY
jgi:AbrB family looped-hinge helix DNA binding protein